MEHVKNVINQSRVVLIMKGTPTYPACGFSKAVVEILNSYEIEYGYFNVLDDSEFRNDIKEYSNWPTFPQLYVDGELIGGADIVREMYVEGELDTVLKATD